MKMRPVENSAGARSEPRDRFRFRFAPWFRRTLFLLYPFCIIIFLLMTSIAHTWETWDDQGELITLEVARPWVWEATEIIGSIAYRCFLLLIVAAIIEHWSRRHWRAALAWLLAFIMFPVCLLQGAFGHAGDWVREAEMTGPDGGTYCYMSYFFWQAKNLAFCRVVGQTRYLEKMEVLGTTNYDSPRMYASIVRPAREGEDRFDPLLKTDSGMVLGFLTNTNCYFAYDF